jgi:hypothetical protein
VGGYTSRCRPLNSECLQRRPMPRCLPELRANGRYARPVHLQLKRHQSGSSSSRKSAMGTTQLSGVRVDWPWRCQTAPSRLEPRSTNGRRMEVRTRSGNLSIRGLRLEHTRSPIKTAAFSWKSAETQLQQEQPSTNGHQTTERTRSGTLQLRAMESTKSLT